MWCGQKFGYQKAKGCTVARQKRGQAGRNAGKTEKELDESKSMGEEMCRTESEQMSDTTPNEEPTRHTTERGPQREERAARRPVDSTASPKQTKLQDAHGRRPQQKVARRAVGSIASAKQTPQLGALGRNRNPSR